MIQARFQGTGVSRSTIRSSFLCPGCCLVQKYGSPLAATSGLTLAACLRVQRLAIGAAIANPTNARAASRAAGDFRISKPTPFRTLWFWSPRRSFA
jgi:hypothetical protein